MSGLSAAWAIETLIASTLLMGFVLLIRRPAQRVIGPQLAYWLWALPVLRMALPPLPAAWREETALPIADAGETVLVYLSPALIAANDAAVAAATPVFPWLPLIGAAWTIGATLFFVWHGAAHLTYVRRILAPPARQDRLPDGTMLVESDEAVGPVAFGVLRRFVAVPTDFADRWDADERRLALAHELGHHARGDLVANWIALAMLALHWWNPLAWVAYRKFRGDQEMANDARVLAGLPPIERHTYACAIVKAAHGRAITAACHLHTIEDLKGRLRMLKNNRKPRRVLAAGAMGIGALTAVGLGLTASSAAAERIRTVAAVQAPLLAAQAAAVVAPPPPPMAASAPVPPTPPAPPRQVRKVVIVRDGKPQTYEGPAADAFLAANPEFAEGIAEARDGRPSVVTTRRMKRMTIRDKDGKVRTYEGAEADAYLKAHPEATPPLPPLAPLAPGAPLPPVSVFSGADGKVIVSRVDARGRDGKSFRIVVPQVVDGHCDKGDGDQFIVREKRGKQPITIICRNRIERFAVTAARQGEWQARMGLSQALAGLETGRRAIETNRNLSDAERKEALAGIANARIEVERELRELKAD